ncbi:hypothetical protein AVEN_186909-1 [Araneus ventricosus]|uniref:Histone-lysine N-methyltransferase SETMAR n=1 Tax=Araneus ventricosus TaxID=182803 RepID=A0A4Y2NCB9_ARAVE|nr:hypothetical protein AVEN_186909-1 [Araneus ventricosus]
MLIKVRKAIREKRRNEFRRKVVLFHQDNARPHVHRLDTLQAGVGFDTTSTIQPRHGPFGFLFSDLQLHLDGAFINSNEEVINEVHLFLDSRAPQFFAEGIEKFPKRLQTIEDLNGDYYPH